MLKHLTIAVVLCAAMAFAAVAHAQPGNVAVFNNPTYIDNSDSPFGAEGPNTVASLQSFNGERHTVHGHLRRRLHRRAGWEGLPRHP